ncbi:hypothetical protein C8R44DRAFT_973823 [Mycena epipterygia]|nr:hypothetical protein C8R44DRAFT_973823 [Mycena epipterygia]
MFSPSLSRLLAAVFLAISFADASSLPACAPNSHPDYDYVVVGSGVGGGPVAARLAENGFSVLVVEAGENVINVNTTIPLYFGRAVEDPKLELNYTYNEYSPGAQFPRDGAWYPRARGLGGSTIHNAMLNNIADTKQDFNNLATMFNDPTWSYTNMRNYFKRIENNLSLNKTDPDHGFNGWLKTTTTPSSLTATALTDPQFASIVSTISGSGPIINDVNSVANVEAVGVGIPSYTIDESRNRTSVRSRLTDVQVSSKGKLAISYGTLATKIALCDPGHGGIPTAYGVEIAVGGAISVASNFNGIKKLTTRLVTVRHEVIVSAGVFQSPQLLMLSGIGNQTELQKNGITPVVNLPGVGANLQDHDEVASVWRMKENYTLFDGCTFLYTPGTDPCIASWESSGHQNIYGFGPALFTIMARSSPSMSQPDLFTYWLPADFRGFNRGFAQELAENHNTLTGVVLKAHPSTRGLVTLTGNDPQDPVHIEKHHFEAAGGSADINAILTGIKSAWSLAQDGGIEPHIAERIFPAPNVTTDTEIKDHILENVFGHHACCTNKMGAANDPMAVLDGNFKVRGVANLRVVDISSWPTIPGFFVATPTYMLSEKAADVIMAATRN